MNTINPLVIIQFEGCPLPQKLVLNTLHIMTAATFHRNVSTLELQGERDMLGWQFC